MDKQILYDIIKGNESAKSRELLYKFVDENEFVLTKDGKYADAIGDTKVRFELIPFNKLINI